MFAGSTKRKLVLKQLNQKRRRSKSETDKDIPHENSASDDIICNNNGICGRDINNLERFNEDSSTSARIIAHNSGGICEENFYEQFDKLDPDCQQQHEHFFSGDYHSEVVENNEKSDSEESISSSNIENSFNRVGVIVPSRRF